MGKLLRVGGMRRCCSLAYTPRGYMLKGWRARPSRGAGRGHRAASSLSGGDSGRRRANTAPRPGPEEVAVRVPPWASINALEMVRPIPAPPLSRLRAAPPVEAFEDVSELARWDVLADKTVLKMTREMGLRCGIRRERAYHRYNSYRGTWGKASRTSSVATSRPMAPGRNWVPMSPSSSSPSVRPTSPPTSHTGIQQDAK